MSYTALELITEALFISGISSAMLETPQAAYVSIGLRRLNAFISFHSANIGMIPYYKRFDFQGILGQQDYPIDDLIEADTLTFTINTVRYSMQKVQRDRFFGTARANGLESLPTQWDFERNLNGGTIYIYPLPFQNLDMQVSGKFVLQNVDLYTDLSLIQDKFYSEYLLYGLVGYLCGFFNIVNARENIDQFKKYEQLIRNLSAQDLTEIKTSVFGGDIIINYGIVNLGRGFYPV